MYQLSVPLLPEQKQKQNQFKKQSTVKYKIEWDRGNTNLYKTKLKELLAQQISIHNNQTTTDIVAIIIDCLKKAEKQSIPSRIIKLNGPKIKVSPEAKRLLNLSKQKHRIWVVKGRPTGTDKSYIERKEAKYNARKILRKERAIEKENFYHQLEQQPSNKTFFKLINRNMGRENLNTPVIQHENKEISCPVEQKEVLAKYYEQLATPQISNEYDKEYLKTCQLRCNIIKELAQNNKVCSIDFSEDEILAAIKNLNSGKAGDEYGLFSEHLKLAGSEITPVLKFVFNKIIKERRTPEQFKTGIITPVCKKGKDSSLLDSYRGITVSSILGKTFEHALLNKIINKLDNRSSQQFGFSQGLSPSMAALLISEAQMNSKQMKEILYLATLDTKKAFDVVNHDILLDKLFQRDIPLDIWETIYEMYHDLTSRINWKGKYSTSFPIRQGVRQGGILSTHFYKAYIEDLLIQLEESNVGLHLGTNYSGCPTCADDILLLSNSDEDMQVILEVLPLNARQLKALSDFHSTFLRNIQSLPVRTASVAIYALLGALPLEAELHKRQLSLLHSILTSENQNLKEILIRQYRLQVHQGTFLERTESILNKYNLPTIEELWENTPTKINWKHTTRSAIIKFWQEWIKTEISQKSTLHRLDINSINIGETHAVWNTALNLPGETKRAIIKARILTGTYMLQANKAKFQIENADSTCPICRIEEENLIHFITRCPVLEGIRRKHYGTIKQEIVNKIGSIQWNSKFVIETLYAN
ncbi:Hypothetical predicted protein [Mytilus galloprovincialis]|uniref:Reverse transcriptase domain-containing protein n=1 Tax=Mytilus galloprovincialis TaxID=29158 RepID=A0A8B6G904_MYTGA|nr:Hypothetical predicted protein [Mytilus galloprovincialis]